MKQLSLVALLVLFSAPAMAYVGPGLGMGVIGTVFGVLAAIVLALFGLFWYPLKRALNKKKAAAAAKSAPTDGEHAKAAHPEDLPTRIQSPSEVQTDNTDTHYTAALNETTESTTVKRTESQV